MQVTCVIGLLSHANRMADACNPNAGHQTKAEFRLIVELRWRNAYIIGYLQDNSNDSRDIQKGKTEQEARG